MRFLCAAATHKVAEKTRQGAQKVEDKTEPQ